MPSPSPLLLSIAKHATFKYTMTLWNRICDKIAFVHRFCWILSPRRQDFFTHLILAYYLWSFLPSRLQSCFDHKQNSYTNLPWYTWEIAKVSDETEKYFVVCIESKVLHQAYHLIYAKADFRDIIRRDRPSLTFDLALYLIIIGCCTLMSWIVIRNYHVTM